MTATVPPTDPLLPPGRWSLDMSRSRAEFRVKHTWGLATVKGHLKPLSGSLTIDQDHQWSMELILDATTVTTGNRMRDKDLRSDKFFNIEHHPTVRFISTNAIHSEERLHVTGELTAGGHSATIEPATTLHLKGTELELDAEATLDQHLLGMTHSPLGMVKTPSTLYVHAVLLPED
jgi:polyisoprenoid-binding protein YceI